VDEFCGLGLALLGMTADEFFECRIGLFYNALNAYYREQMNRQRFTADMVRLQTLTLLNIQIKKSDRIKTPAELWSFPWDDEEEEKPSDEEIRRRNEEILNKFNNG